jgi:threonine/homoserine/homoserine lactone efflux protein
MGEAIGQTLPIAVGIAISPLPIVAVVLMLAGPRGRVNGPAFVLAWIAGLAAVGVIVIAAMGDEAQAGADGPRGWVSWLELALGVVLLGVAAREWRGRPRGDAPAPLPRWLRALDAAGPGRAAAAGVALSALNPKNLVLAVAGATAIAQAGVPAGQEVGALAVFVVIGAIGVAAPVVLDLLLADRSRRALDAMRDHLARGNATIMAILALVIAAKLIGDAVSGLSA